MISLVPTTGLLQLTHSGGDARSFDITWGPAEGAVTIDADGTFTYVPTATAGHTAAEGATPAERQDSFTVTVGDGRSGVATVPASAVISPADTPPVMTLTVTESDDTTGSVNVSVTVSVIVTDSVVYLVIHDATSSAPLPSPYGPGW